MIQYSIGVELAWQYGAQEAACARHEFMEPEHLLIGLCSLEKVLDPQVIWHLKERERDVAGLRAEWGLLEKLFARFKLDPTILR